MRILVLSRIYRAFPELDRYSDDQCQRFVRAARRLGFWRRAAHILALGLPSLLVVTLATLASAYVFHTLDSARRTDSPWPLVLALAAMVLLLAVGLVAVALLRDLLLRRRITYVLRARGICSGCHYSLVGLPVEPSNTVHCPECGMQSQVDPSLGELVVDHAGQTRFQPRPHAPGPLARWLSPARRLWIKRAAIWSLIALPVLAGAIYGIREYRLAAQARRAVAARPGLPGLLAVQLKWAPGSDTEPQPGEPGNAWTYLTQAALAAEQAWANAQPSPAPADASGQSLFGDWSLAWTPQDPALADENDLLRDSRLRRNAEIALSNDMFTRVDRAPIDALLRQASAAPAARWDIIVAPNQPLFSAQLAQLGKPRMLARYAAARVRRAIQLHDHREALDAIEATLAITRACARQPFLIGGLVAAAIEAVANSSIRLLLADAPDPATLDVLEALLQRHRGSLSLLFALETERVAAKDTAAFIFTKPENIRLGAASPALVQLLGSQPAGRLGSLEENLAALDAFFQHALAQAAKPPHARDPIDLPDTGLALVDGLRPALAQSALSFDMAEVHRLAILTLIALERHRLAKGTYPERLHDLVPEFLPQLPIDPFSNLPLGYAKLAPRPSARPFVLYAPGSDRLDNGGASTLDELAALRPNAKPGNDYVLNPQPK